MRAKKRIMCPRQVMDSKKPTTIDTKKQASYDRLRAANLIPPNGEAKQGNKQGFSVSNATSSPGCSHL